MTALGPQSPNYTTTRPPVDPVVSGALDTWFVDCSAPGAVDGTIPTASWFNGITAQLRTAISAAGVTLDDLDDTMLQQAINALALNAMASLTGSRGVRRAVDDFQLSVGQGIDPTLDSGTVSVLDDILVIYDASGAVVSEISAYELGKAILGGVGGLTFDDVAGTIAGSTSTHTAAATAPAGPSVNDTWWNTTTDELFRFTDDGTSQFWIQIA